MNTLSLALVFLASAVIAVPICKRLGLGSVLGYLLVGALLGPWGMFLVADPKQIFSFSELGVVMLLFVIGLELKPSRLWVMRRAVFGLGGAQVVLTTLVFAAAGRAFGIPWPAAALAGLGLSLSSTPFALQMLAEKNQVNTSHGRTSFAILLFQDLAVIPLLALLPLMGGTEVAHGPKALPILVALVVVIGGGRFLLPRFFRIIAWARIKEVFIAATLLVVLGTALIMEEVGLSMALGTFIAGVLLSDSEYRHELEADIEPFKGLLLGLFFMAVGMSVNLKLLLEQPLTIVGLTIALMATKYLILYGIGRASGFTDETARRMAGVLPQGGEFAFVLFNVAATSALVDRALADQLVLVVTLSMALTPLLLGINEKFCLHATCPSPDQEKKKQFDAVPDEGNPVLIAGFGRVGQIVGRLLRVRGIGFTALEHDPEQVQVIRRFGNEIYYGDASRIDLLEAAGAARAKYFVLAIDNIESSVQTATILKQHFPHLRIFARVRNRQHAYELMNLGITDLFRETFGTSLELGENLLKSLGSSSEEAKKIVAKFRLHDEKMLLDQHKVYKDEAQLINVSKQAAKQLTELIRADRDPRAPEPGPDLHPGT